MGTLAFATLVLVGVAFFWGTLVAESEAKPLSWVADRLGLGAFASERERLIGERKELMRLKDSLVAFPRSNGGATAQDKAEAKVLAFHAQERIRRINERLASLDLDDMRRRLK